VVDIGFFIPQQTKNILLQNKSVGCFYMRYLMLFAIDNDPVGQNPAKFLVHLA